MQRAKVLEEPGRDALSWVEDCPNGWKIRPLKFASLMNPETLNEDTEADRQFHYIDIASVDTNGKVTTGGSIRFAEAPSRARRIVRTGDTILATVRTYLKAIAFIDKKLEGAVASTGFAVLRPRPDVLPRFLWRFVQSEPFVNAVVANSVGVSYPAVNPSDLGVIPVLLPPEDQQRVIADFLDRETAKIDRLIEEKQRLIELLEEKRTALITQAVTKGLDPDVELKDSGVEWLGEIPAHWDVVRIGHLCSSIQTGPFGSQLHANEYVRNGIPVLNPSNLTAERRLMPTPDSTVSEEVALRLARHRLTPEDIVVARRGELGRCAVTQAEEVGWICGTGCLRLRPNEAKADAGFVALVISFSGTRHRLLLESVGSTMGNLNASIVGRTPCPLPPLEEQRRIRHFVEEREEQLSKVEEHLQSAMAFLREYRSALISAAVTGKIDVREEAA